MAVAAPVLLPPLLHVGHAHVLERRAIFEREFEGDYKEDDGHAGEGGGEDAVDAYENNSADVLRVQAEGHLQHQRCRTHQEQSNGKGGIQHGSGDPSSS